MHALASNLGAGQWSANKLRPTWKRTCLEVKMLCWPVTGSSCVVCRQSQAQVPVCRGKGSAWLPPVIGTWLLSHIGATAGVLLSLKCGVLEHSARLTLGLWQHFTWAKLEDKPEAYQETVIVSHHIPQVAVLGIYHWKHCLVPYICFHLDCKENVKTKSYLIGYINTNHCLHKTSCG